MEIKILGVPVFQGCGMQGIDEAPDYLRSQGVYELLKTKHTVTDLGNLELLTSSEEHIFEACKDIKYYDVLLDMNTKIAATVNDIVSRGEFAITVGGDHSLGAGSVAGASVALAGDIGVIWFDAHADMNTPLTSPSKNYHGMSFATSMYVGDRNMRSIGEDKRKVKAANSFLVGVRDMDAGEVELRDSTEVNHVTMGIFRKKGAVASATDVINTLRHNGVKHIHLSFDLDVLSPEVTSAFNCPVAGGVMLDECTDFIRTIAQSGMLCSMDYTEYNPQKDSDGSGLNAAREIFTALAEGLK